MKSWISIGFVLSICTSLFAQTHLLQWQPGPYQAGYQMFEEYDYSRRLKPVTNYEGKTNPFSPVPVQISVWYPAQIGSTPVPMQLETYMWLNEQKEDFGNRSSEKKNNIRNTVKFLVRFGLGTDLPDDTVEAILQSNTSSYRNAVPLPNQFPLIISGLDGGPANQFALYEYLASQGYVVLSTPSISVTATQQATQPQLAMNDRIRNMEYLLAFSRQLSFADQQNIGILGINFDGMAGLLFQMKHMCARGIVSIDGWEIKNNSVNTVKQSIYFDPLKLRVPYLTIQQHEASVNQGLAHNLHIFHQLKYAERYYFSMQGFNHFQLTTNYLYYPGLSADKKRNYYYLFNSIATFFNATLKNDMQEQVSLSKLTTESYLPPNFFAAKVTAPALKSVPTREEFEAILMKEQNVQKAIHLYREGKKENPDLQLFDLQTVYLYTFRFRSMNKPDEALAMAELGIEAFPASLPAWEHIGNTCMEITQKAKAVAYLKNALAKLDKVDLIKSDKEKIKNSLSTKLQALQKQS